MTHLKRLAMLLMATAVTTTACKKAVLDTEEAGSNTNSANTEAVASPYRVLVNGVNVGKGISSYQNPLVEGTVILVDAQVFLERLGYGLSIVNPTAKTYTCQRLSSGSSVNNAPNAATYFFFTNGSNRAKVQARGSATIADVVMPAATTFTTGGRMMVPAIWLAQQAGIPAKLVEDDKDSQSLQCYYYEECDYGLYFMGAQANNATDAIGSEKFEAGSANRFFNPAKPTIIYVHGWQPNAVRNFTRENLFINEGGLTAHTQNAWINATAGWNVAIFNWIQLADDDYAAAAIDIPDSVEVKMYNPSFAGIGMRWRRTDNTIANINHPSTPKRCVAGLLAAEINKIRAANPNVELRLVGNSLGGNLVMAAISPNITQLPIIAGFPNAALTKAPERVALMDPYWCRPSIGFPSIVNNLAFGETSGQLYYNLPNSALEYYRTSILGLNGYNRGLAKYCAYINFIPGYTSDFGKKHTVPVRQYFHSFGMTTTARPLELLETGLFSNQRAMCAQTSNARIRNMMTQVAYWDHAEPNGGSGTANMDDDTFKRVLGDPQ